MLVYRVEHKETKKGPYTSMERIPYKAGRKINDWHNNDHNHPGPFAGSGWRESDQEIPYFDANKHRFGFDSLEQLNEWFEGWISLLKENGFQIVVFEVKDDKVIKGKSGKQCVYEHNKATFVENIQLTA